MKISVIVLAGVLLLISPLRVIGASQPAKVGDEVVEEYQADITGDGVKDTILLRKTVTGVYQFSPKDFDYEVVIEILSGKDGKSLFKSQKFSTIAIGIINQSGNLDILSEKSGPVKVEYTETTIYTEVIGPTGNLTKVRKYLFEWDGKRVKTTVLEIEENN